MLTEARLGVSLCRRAGNGCVFDLRRQPGFCRLVSRTKGLNDQALGVGALLQSPFFAFNAVVVRKEDC